MNRRDFLLSTTGLALAPAEVFGRETVKIAASYQSNIQSSHGKEGFAITGYAMPEFQPMDAKVSKWLQENEKPGGVLVIARAGRLIYARGFGYADTASKRPFLPTTTFRYGSVAKWFTAMGIMRQVEKGVVRLDDPITVCKPLLPLLTPEVRQDIRLELLTFRNLLSHLSGLKYTAHFRSDWYRIKGGQLVTLEETVRFGLTEGFHARPGTDFEYTNFNYILAHFLLEKLSGQPLDALLQQEVFKRAGVKGISLAGSRKVERLLDESQYYLLGEPSVKSIWPEDNGKEIDPAYNVDWRTPAGAGGFRGSALSLLRLMVEFGYDGNKPPLKRESVGEMINVNALQNPPCTTHGLALGAGSDFKNGYYWGTGGMTPGMSTTITRRADSTIYVFAFNKNNDLDPGNGPLNDLVLQTLDSIREQPQVDLWPRYSARGTMMGVRALFTVMVSIFATHRPQHYDYRTVAGCNQA